MVKDKKVDVIARDYTINLHKALHGMYAAPTPHSSSSLGLRGSVCGGTVGLGARGNSGARRSARPAAAPLGPRRGCRGGAAG